MLRVKPKHSSDNINAEYVEMMTMEVSLSSESRIANVPMRMMQNKIRDEQQQFVLNSPRCRWLLWKGLVSAFLVFSIICAEGGLLKAQPAWAIPTTPEEKRIIELLTDSNNKIDVINNKLDAINNKSDEKYKYYSFWVPIFAVVINAAALYTSGENVKSATKETDPSIELKKNQLLKEDAPK